MRRLIVTAIAVTFMLAVGISGATAAAFASTLPPEGIFETCQLDTEMQTCLQRLDVMHQGAMQVVVIGAGGVSLNSLSTYANAAHSLGMSVMWELSNPAWWQNPTTSTSISGYFPAFAQSCGCQQDGQVLAYTVHWLSQLPGTYGYYAADDSMLSPSDETGVAQYVAQIQQQDPVHTVMIGSANEAQTQQYQSIPNVIGAEIYPVTTRPLVQVSSNPNDWDWSSVAQIAAEAQSSASAAGKQSAFILQAFTWGDNLSDGQAIGICTASDTQASCYSKLRYPSAGDQVKLRNEVLTHAHPKLILWWSFPGTYGQAGTDTYSIYPTGAEAAARWSGLSAAIQAPAPRTPAAHRAHIARKDLLVTRSAVTAAGSGGSISPQPNAPSTTGATVTYTDTQAAQTTLTVLRALPRIEARRGCVAAARRDPIDAKSERCIRFVAVGSFTRQDRTGANSFHFTGRVNSHKLRRGNYRLLARATFAPRLDTSDTTTFRIVG